MTHDLISSNVDKMRQDNQPLTMVDLLEIQKALQRLMGDPTGFGEPSVKENVLAMHAELSEVLAEINWKPWKRHNQKLVNRDTLLMELTDVLQFWGNAVNAMGFTAEEVKLSLLAKWLVNVERINDGEVTRG